MCIYTALEISEIVHTFIFKKQLNLQSWIEMCFIVHFHELFFYLLMAAVVRMKRLTSIDQYIIYI